MNSKRFVKFIDTDRGENQLRMLGPRLEKLNIHNVMKGLYQFNVVSPGVKFLDTKTATFKLQKTPWRERSCDNPPDSPCERAQTSAQNAPDLDNQPDTQLLLS